jgi:hypothetical protein
VAFPRQGAGANILKQGSSLAAYRLNPEKTLQCNLRGIGRVAADCWPVPGRKYRLCGSPGQFNFYASIVDFFAPLEAGPVCTTRSEMFREGLQVREAITYLLQTLDGGRLDAALAAKVDALVLARAHDMLVPEGHADWFRDEDALFALCAEVAEAVRGRDGGG